MLRTSPKPQGVAGIQRSERLDMSQHSVVGIEQRTLQIRASSEVASRFAPAFRNAFSKPILPKDRFFRPSEAPLYITARSFEDWTDGDQGEVAKDTGSYVFEAMLDEQFWDEDSARLVFIEGQVGSGKSTLLEYYLRSYCPHAGQNRQLFDKKLLISIDFRSTRTEQDFDKLFMKGIKECISRACGPEIEAADGYEMWDPVFHFDGPVFQDAVRAAGDAEAFKARLVLERQVDDETWVNLALRYLAKKAKGGRTDATFQYTVLCLDNLDQSTVEVLQRAIYRIRKWIDETEEEMPVWRVYLPVWPGTRALFLETCAPLPHFYVLQLPGPAPTQLLAARFGVLEEAADKDPESGIEGNFLRDCIGWSNPRFDRFLANISGGSVRMLMELWQSIISSRNLFDNYREMTEDGSVVRSLSNYRLLDAVLTGAYGVHHAAENPILNAFHLDSEADGPVDRLLGPLLLFALRSGVRSYQDTIARLTGIGFESVAVERCLDRLRVKRIFYLAGGARREIYVLEGVLSSCISLLDKPAYLNNVAVTTPVEDRFRNSMSFTRGSSPTLFLEKTRTTLTFLLQLRKDEQRLEKLVSTKRSRNAALEAWALNLPSIYKYCANGFLDHLRVIRSSRTLRDISDSNWDRLLKHEAFTALEEWPDSIHVLIDREERFSGS